MEMCPFSTAAQSDYLDTLTTTSDLPFDEDIERFTADCLSHFFSDGAVQHMPGIPRREETHSPTTPRKRLVPQKSVRELLASFDPQNPPDMTQWNDDPRQALEEMQLWLECEAQQESVIRYQKVIENARNRKDYGSLSMVQNQILEWFQPLHDSIEKRQHAFILRRDSGIPSAQKFGPLICTLPPAKLAVITAHEALMSCVLHRSRHSNDRLTLTRLACTIGQAVEDEVLVHRFLHQRFKQAQKDTLGRKQMAALLSISDLDTSNDTEQNNNNPEHKTQKKEEEEDPAATLNSSTDNNNALEWDYVASHLKSFLDEITRYNPTAKKRRTCAYAVERAKQALEGDNQWSELEKIQLGAALIHSLLEVSKVKCYNNEEPAFSIEKKWIEAGKIMTFVTMSDYLTNMILSDKMESLSATTTRHKPMVVPPLPWTASNRGGYRVLNVDLVRYHGCRTQREALNSVDNSIVFDGLNALARVPWKINKEMLNVAQTCWENNVSCRKYP
jgi:DNA-directed RNA polymerase